jgi:adenosylcobinamide amidohydrolase
MAKVNAARIAALKALYELGDTLTEQNFADLIDAIAEAAQEHEHVANGGPGTGTGNAFAVGTTRYAGPITVGVTAVAPAVFVGG